MAGARKCLGQEIARLVERAPDMSAGGGVVAVDGGQGVPGPRPGRGGSNAQVIA